MGIKKNLKINTKKELLELLEPYDDDMKIVDVNFEPLEGIMEVELEDRYNPYNDEKAIMLYQKMM